MWLIATMHPPVAGIFSPSIQVREVAASRVGLRIDAATVIAHPRSWSSFLTRTSPLLALPVRECRLLGRTGRGPPAARWCRMGGSAVMTALPDRPETPVATRPTCVVVVPVKPPALGKSRLVGLTDEQRRELAEAFALDTVAAAGATTGVEAVLVVTDDFRLASALRGEGVEVMPDGVSEDLNETLVQAAAEVVRRWPGAVPVALCADLPGLRSDELAAVLA